MIPVSRISLALLFVLFVVMNGLYLHQVPGLLGDEASEGENVYELLQAERLPLLGERSYIGPLIDYVRVPFIGMFGYTVLALRVPMLLISIATLWLAYLIFRRTFDAEYAALLVAVVFFSPVFVTMQRLGWAISLQLFFLMLSLWFLLSSLPYKYVWAGLAVGLGVHTHVLFLPVGVAVGAVWLLVELWKFWLSGFKDSVTTFGRGIVHSVAALVGVMAGAGTQLAVLYFFRDDQGAPDKVAALVSERWDSFFELVPVIFSGSSYIARYTGIEFSGSSQWMIVGILFVLAVLGLGWSRHRAVAWLWALGLAIHLEVLMIMIDRFTLRYFVLTSFGAWLLAAVGLAVLIEWGYGWQRRLGFFTLSRSSYFGLKAAGISVVLSLVAVLFIFIPFLRTGGSLNDFSLGNRTNSASAAIAVEPLVACLRSAGPVYSDNVHIYNRLLFLSHQYHTLDVVRENESKQGAHWIVRYREEGKEVIELCPELDHWQVFARDRDVAGQEE